MKAKPWGVGLEGVREEDILNKVKIKEIQRDGIRAFGPRKPFDPFERGKGRFERFKKLKVCHLCALSTAFPHNFLPKGVDEGINGCHN